MAGKSNKLKIKKLQINFTDKWFYTFVVVISLIAIGVGVYAAAGTTPNPGHAITDLQPCDTGEILKSGATGWTCGTDEVGTDGTSLWIPNGSDIYYNDGNVGIGTTGPKVGLHITAGSATIALDDPGVDNSMWKFDHYSDDDSLRIRKADGEGTLLFDALTINQNGSVGIGISDLSSYNSYKLAVGGPLISTGPLYTTQYGVFEKGIVISNHDGICSSDVAGTLRYRQDCAASSCTLYLEICTSFSSPPSYNWRVLVEKTFISLNPPSDPEKVTPPDPDDIQTECDPGFDYEWCTGCFHDPDCYNLDEEYEDFLDFCYWSPEDGECE